MKAAQENYVNSSNLRFESFEERMQRTEKRNAELEAIAKSSMDALAAVNAELALLREQIARRNQAGADSALLSFLYHFFFISLMIACSQGPYFHAAQELRG